MPGVKTSDILATKIFNNTRLELRLLRRDELAEIVQLDKELFSPPWPKDSFEKELANPISTTYVVAADNIIAYAVIWYIADEMQIAKIAVVPAFQQLGIASWMMESIFSEARVRGITHAFIEVRQSNRGAIELYRKFGFAESGVRRDYYESPKENALLMAAVI